MSAFGTGRAGRRVGGDCLDHALNRIFAEIHDGLRHGHFSFTLTCEVIGGEQRRLILHAGKSYLFVISSEDACLRAPASPIDSRHGSDPPHHVEDAGHRRHDERATGSTLPLRARAADDA
jgi:hypothetical protein